MTGVQPADARPSIAVLPFDNMSGNENETYFADGLTEDIINELARNPELQIIARNSTFAFRDQATDIREIGSKAWRKLCRRRKRAARRRSAADRGAADRHTQRRASVVAELRPARRGRVCRADRPHHRDRRAPRLLCSPIRSGRGSRAGRPRTCRPTIWSSRDAAATSTVPTTAKRCWPRARSTSGRWSLTPAMRPHAPISA